MMRRNCLSVVGMVMLAVTLVFQAPSPAAQRTVLVESFTQWNCGYCAWWIPQEEDVLAAMTRDTVVAIRYHVWWPAPNNDAFYLWNTSEVSARKNYYSVPWVSYNRIDGTSVGRDTVSIYEDSLRAHYNVPAICELEVHAWAAGTTSVGFCATVTAEQTITNGRLMVALITDHVHYATAPGNNGETDFYDIFRDMSPNTSGWLVMLSPGEDSTYTGTLNREASWAPADLSVVAFVQQPVTKEVFQASWSEVSADAPALPAVANLVARYAEESSGLRLAWTHVAETTVGCPLSGRRYVVYRNAAPGFDPQPADSVGGTTDSTFVDTSVLTSEKNFYCVRAVSQ